MRIMNTMVDYPSSILRDISLSNYSPNVLFYSNYEFYNSSWLITADRRQGFIYGYSLQNPYLVFPEYTFSQFKKVEDIWGKSPYQYSIILTSGNFSHPTPNYTVDRGATKLSSSSDSSSLETWKVVLLILSLMFIFIIIVVFIYKYYWKRRIAKKAFDESDLTNHSWSLYQSSALYSTKGPKAY